MPQVCARYRLPHGMLGGVSTQQSSHEAERRRLAARAAGRHPTPATEARSRNMQAIRRTDTKPEVALRSALHRRGLRFRKDFRIDADGITVRPDIVFTKAYVAVFVDGCFWHLCPEHGHIPARNNDYWRSKLSHNQERDRLVSMALRGAGWRVVRIWEHVGTDESVRMVFDACAESHPTCFTSAVEVRLV